MNGLRACSQSTTNGSLRYASQGRSERRFVAIDETKQKIDGRQLFVWSAIDVETKELLAIYASHRRSSFTALLFVGMVLGTCFGKLVILVDGLFMLWYNHLWWHQGLKGIPGGELI